MTVAAMSAAWDARGLDPTQRVVYLAYADGPEGAPPRYDLLEEKTELSREAVEEALTWLVERGYIRPWSESA